MRTRQRSTNNTFALAGWLFADLFIMLTILFLTTSTSVPPANINIPPTPTPTPTPRIISSLDVHPLELTLSTNQYALLNGDSATITDVQQQIRQQLPRNQQLTAGIVMTFSGGNNTYDEQETSDKINKILAATSGQSVIFNSTTVYKDYIASNDPAGKVSVEIYVYAYK